LLPQLHGKVGLSFDSPAARPRHATKVGSFAAAAVMARGGLPVEAASVRAAGWAVVTAGCASSRAPRLVSVLPSGATTMSPTTSWLPVATLNLSSCTTAPGRRLPLLGRLSITGLVRSTPRAL